MRLRPNRVLSNRYLLCVPYEGKKMTMYQNKLVASIRVNGKILREFKDTVYIPFGSEYSILLKNLNSVRALVNVYVDGENVVPGGLVLNAGQECDLERSIKNGNMYVGNRFKFIERTGKIEDHRGIKLEDGLIRVEFQFEKIFPTNPTLTWVAPVWPYTTGTPYNGNPTWTVNNSVLRSSAHAHEGVACSDMAYGVSNVNNMAVGSASATLSASSAQSFNAAPQTETGITVAGSKSEQKFTAASWFATETTKHTIVLKLLGETEDNKAIREPITVKHKQKCNTCGHTNKATAKFCGECGAGLVIYA